VFPIGTRRSPSRRKRRISRQARVRRRLLFLVLGLVVLVPLGIAAKSSLIEPAIRQFTTLPLQYDDIIRKQAKAKNLDPALIAAVIYAESRFEPQTSSAGAKGLMQILPSTATFIAKKSGGKDFEQGDLATPRVNISYGAFYLRYLLNIYDGNEMLALAAYNAGLGRVTQWIRQEKVEGRAFNKVGEIPFPETRGYVAEVIKTKERYREEYADRLEL
jgi:soluble lytic murein transglycosylase